MLIPAYNESATLCELLGRVLCASQVAQVVLVDDASTDNTTALMDCWLAHPRIDVCRHVANRGKGASIRTALASANGNIVIVQDADVEYDPNGYS